MSQVGDLLNNPKLNPIGAKYNSPGDIINSLVPYIFVAAGLVLLVILIMGGIGLMTSGGNPDKVKSNYSKITNALIGFLVIFIVYFVAQIVQVMLGIDFL